MHLEAYGPGWECGISLRAGIRAWDKFIDNYMHFECMRTGMRTQDKFEDRDEIVAQI